MKKIGLLVLLFALTLVLSACATNVSGKTFVYDSFEYEKAEGLTPGEDVIADIAISAAKAIYENVEVTFNEDGTCVLGSWTQEGTKLTIGKEEYKVSGSKIVLEVVEEDYSYTVKFTIKK